MLPASCSKMATVIRTELNGWWNAVLLAATLAFLPAAQAVEQEIHVTTGPDGIEIFSNLPRDFGEISDLPVTILKGRAVAAVQIPRQIIPEQVTVVSGASEGLAENGFPDSGKSFLLDD